MARVHTSRIYFFSDSYEIRDKNICVGGLS